MEFYTGVKKIFVTQDVIDNAYKNKEIDFPSSAGNISWYENRFFVLKVQDQSGSALMRVSGDKLVLLDSDIKASDVSPRNKEQIMALDILLDDAVKVVALSGLAGSGKSILTLAAAMQLVDAKRYNKIVITRPMTQVGKNSLGYLPGTADEKFMPYLQGIFSNVEFLLKGKKMEDFIKFYNVEFLPLQLLRGASFHNSFIICDETQTLNYHETITLGTRVAEGSKLVMLGDLDQRDEKIAKNKTGLFKFVNSKISKESHLVATLELIKSERSDVSELFTKVFKDE
jgi:PhoH-like ATPase